MIIQCLIPNIWQILHMMTRIGKAKMGVIFVSTGISGNSQFRLFGSALTRPIKNYVGNLSNADQIQVQLTVPVSPYLTPIYRRPGTVYFTPPIQAYQPPTTANMGFTIPVGPLPYHSTKKLPTPGIL